eukprot:9890209-Heterocapsa_arctica.AAC.1
MYLMRPGLRVLPPHLRLHGVRDRDRRLLNQGAACLLQETLFQKLGDSFVGPGLGGLLRELTRRLRRALGWVQQLAPLAFKPTAASLLGFGL